MDTGAQITSMMEVVCKLRQHNPSYTAAEMKQDFAYVIDNHYNLQYGKLNILRSNQSRHADQSAAQRSTDQTKQSIPGQRNQSNGSDNMAPSLASPRQSSEQRPVHHPDPNSGHAASVAPSPQTNVDRDTYEKSLQNASISSQAKNNIQNVSKPVPVSSNQTNETPAAVSNGLESMLLKKGKGGRYTIEENVLLVKQFIIKFSPPPPNIHAEFLPTISSLMVQCKNVMSMFATDVTASRSFVDTAAKEVRQLAIAMEKKAAKIAAQAAKAAAKMASASSPKVAASKPAENTVSQSQSTAKPTSSVESNGFISHTVTQFLKTQKANDGSTQQSSSQAPAKPSSNMQMSISPVTSVAPSSTIDPKKNIKKRSHDSVAKGAKDSSDKSPKKKKFTFSDIVDDEESEDGDSNAEFEIDSEHEIIASGDEDDDDFDFPDEEGNSGDEDDDENEEEVFESAADDDDADGDDEEDADD